MFTIINAGIHLWRSIKVLPLKCSKSSMLGLLHLLPISLYPFSLPEPTDDFFKWKCIYLVLLLQFYKFVLPGGCKNRIDYCYCFSKCIIGPQICNIRNLLPYSRIVCYFQVLEPFFKVNSFVWPFDCFKPISNNLLFPGLIRGCIAILKVPHNLLYMIAVNSIQKIGLSNR